MAAGRTQEGGAGDPRTPMAWQHRDLNYHQSGYQDRYGPGADEGRHRGDKVWPSTSSPHANGAKNSYPRREFPRHKEYPPRDYPMSGDEYPSHKEYSHSRDLSPSDHNYPNSQSRPHGSRSATATSTISSSSSEDSEQPEGPPHPGYGYDGYYPGYPPTAGYPQGTMKSTKSVPSMLAPTVDGEPCPVHHHPPPGAPMPMPPPAMPMPMPHPSMVHPGYATMGPPRRAASIYDMRMMSPMPNIYGTLPHPAPAVAPDARSVVGSTIMSPQGLAVPVGIPPHLLPPMARPRPLVIGEGGAPEVLPVRGSQEKAAAIAKSIIESKSGEDEKLAKQKFCCPGGMCVMWTILSFIVFGILLTLMLMFIL